MTTTTTSYSQRCHCNSFQYFFDLPRELRDKIYFFAMADMPTRHTINKRSPVQDFVLAPHALPSLCFANKQLRRESILVFFQRTRFIFELPSIHHMMDFEDFLSQFDRGFESIRMISVYGVRCFGDKQRDYDDQMDNFYPDALVRQCTGLKSLFLEAQGWFLRRSSETWGKPRPPARLLTVRELRREWGFGSLFGLQKLKYLKFRCVVTCDDLKVLGLTREEDVLVNMTAALKEGFEERGKNVEIVMEAA